MTAPMTIELRCSKNPDGKYNARTFIGGKEQKEKGYSVNRGDLFAVTLICRRIRTEHPEAAVVVKGVDRTTEQSILRSE